MELRPQKKERVATEDWDVSLPPSQKRKHTAWGSRLCLCTPDPGHGIPSLSFCISTAGLLRGSVGIMAGEHPAQSSSPQTQGITVVSMTQTAHRRPEDSRQPHL